MNRKRTFLLQLPLLFILLFSLLTGFNAYAFTTGAVHEAIVTSHQNDKIISDVKQVSGTNNAWSMKFQAYTAKKDGQKSKKYGIPTTLKYAGSKLHITQQLAEVDKRVVKVVLDSSDVKSKLEELKNYDSFSSELTGFSAKVTFDGKRMNLQGSVSIAGKELDEVKGLLVDLREETAELYYNIDEANVEALEDYFEDVLDKDYGAILDTQTFLEVMGHGFTSKNQVRRKESEIGHWSWNVGEVITETINRGRSFEEVYLLNTGTALSQYKAEKMFEEITKRVKARLPKGAKSVVVKAHAVKSGVTAVVLQYPLNKEPSGEDIREYHEKFIKFVTKIYPDMKKITKEFTGSVAVQKIKTLSAQDFMILMDDGLEHLKLYEAGGANGQWKFKFRNVSYIITNHKKIMTLSFISSLPKGRNMDDMIDKVETDIKQSFKSFADDFTVESYKGSEKTIMVEMRFHYGVLSSSEITGKRIKEQYQSLDNQ